jgi:hypothetical protein
MGKDNNKSDLIDGYTPEEWRFIRKMRHEGWKKDTWKGLPIFRKDGDVKFGFILREKQKENIINLIPALMWKR